MLNISFGKLAARASKQVFPHEARLGVDEGHGILQLVAEAKSAARLVVAASSPETTGERLIQEPAVGKEIDGLIRCFHPDCAERPVPVAPHSIECLSCRNGVAEATGETGCVVGYSAPSRG